MSWIQEDTVNERSETIEAIRDSARTLLEAGGGTAQLRHWRGESPGFDRRRWESMAAAGWFSTAVRETDGGLGLGLDVCAAIVQACGENLAPEPVAVAGFAVGELLSRCPGSALRSDLLDRLQQGRLVAGLAWQERSGDTDPRPGGARLSEGPAGMQVAGARRHVVPGAGVDGWVVAVHDEQDACALVWLPAGHGGVQVHAFVRLDGSRAASLEMDARIAAKQVLARGDAADQALESALLQAQVLCAAELLGASRTLLAMTISHLQTRRQFGKAIGSFQVLRHRAVDVYLGNELAAAALDAACGDGLLSPATASRAKARAADSALAAVRFATQAHGAMGVSDETDVGLYFKRVTVLAASGGNAQAHRRRYLRHAPPEGLPAAVPWPEDADIPRGADWASMPEAQFRGLVRAFLRRHYPPALRHLPYTANAAQYQPWARTMSERGWIAPAWPVEMGGLSLPADKLLILHDEYERYGVARGPDMGIVMIGPLLIRYGSAEQRARFLPPIIRAEHIWCQGYSEPNAGSDLASLSTRAELRGDHFVVNGQKIWTTHATSATHMFMLARTDSSGRKQEGISFLLLDLATPGVTIRPIRDIAGKEKFCEVFFDDVVVPRKNLVGELHRGWGIAKSLLGFERLFVGGPKHCQYALAQLENLAAAHGLLDDPVFAARFAQGKLDVADLGTLYERFADGVRRGEDVPPSIALLKIWATETHQRLAWMLLEAANEDGVGVDPVAVGDHQMHVAAPLFAALPSTIYGGANEVQRDIVARHVLQLTEP